MTNTYDTSGEPLGSTSVKVLYNNASNFDDALNSFVQSWIDRFGVSRKTWYGFEQDFNNFLIASSFEAVHLIYVAGTPLRVDRATQLIDYNGSVYRVKMPATFPVNLTGVWATDSAKLVDVGDQSLRQALAGTGGTAMIGRPGGTLEAFLQTLAVAHIVALDNQAFDRPLGAGDLNKYLQVTEPTDIVRTIAPQSAVAWPANATLEIMNDSDTNLLIAPGTGVTLAIPFGKTNKVLPRGSVRVKRLAADRWAITSDLIAAKRPGPMYLFGDSITFGVGATTPAQSYAAVEAQLMGRTVGNQGVSASMVWDQLAVLYAFTILRTETTQIMIGTNDRLTRGTSDAYQQQCFQAGHLAALVWMAIPDEDRVYPDNPNCTYTPSANWGAAAYGKINAKYAAIVGSKVTVPFAGDTVYLHYLKVDGKVATGEIRIDGTLVNSINCAGSGGGTILGATSGAAVLRITGLSAGAHSLEINVSVGGAGGFVTFLGISVPNRKKAFPRANVCGIIRTKTPSEDAAVLTYNTMIQTNVNILQNDGLDVVYMDSLAAVNTTTDMYDNLHPNDSGHAKLGRTAAMVF